MSEVIKRYDLDGLSPKDGRYVYIQDLLSGHVLEHEGKRYALVPMECTREIAEAAFVYDGTPPDDEAIENTMTDYNLMVDYARGAE